MRKLNPNEKVNRPNVRVTIRCSCGRDEVRFLGPFKGTMRNLIILQRDYRNSHKCSKCE